MSTTTVAEGQIQNNSLGSSNCWRQGHHGAFNDPPQLNQPMFKDTRPLIATGSWGPKYPCELFFHPTAAEGPQRPSDIEAGARELHYCGLGTCWTQGPGPHQSSPCPATSSGYNERKERDLGGKQEPEIPSARSGPGRAAWRWQAMANVRRSCHRTLTVVGSPGLPTLALVPAPHSCHQQEGTSLAPSLATILAQQPHQIGTDRPIANVGG